MAVIRIKVVNNMRWGTHRMLDLMLVLEHVLVQKHNKMGVGWGVLTSRSQNTKVPKATAANAKLCTFSILLVQIIFVVCKPAK